jgi:hypothetical protein
MDPKAKVASERFRKYAPELELLLWAVWDPIGAGVPIDEYESYVPVIWKLLHERAGAEVVSTALAQIAEERIGLDRGTSRSAAERLTQWWYWRFDFPEEFNANS